MTHDMARNDLLAFEAAQPVNFWRADPHLQQILRHWVGATPFASWEHHLDAFGAETAGPIDAAVRRNNLGHNLPREERWSPYGERMEEVEHHPSFHLAGRGIYAGGVIPAVAKRGNNAKALALFYLSSHVGEAGHNCPLACTAGLIKALREIGSTELQDRYMPRLTSTDYATLAHGGQFLTEVQGGSDVGANTVRAVPTGAANMWELHGEKWFCSNVTADLILVTARPDDAPSGTKGLGLFLMPRRLPDGSLNSYSIRRLKDKIGTRTLPTAELDLNGAMAHQVGPLDSGFRNMMTYVINTSRVFNAVGCAGMAHRACLVGQGYAAHRRSFGAPILHYPLVQETLADMQSETRAMVSGIFYLVHVLDRIERGEANAIEQHFWRVGINLNKTRNAISSHEVILSALELLGGNGTIETFSVVPRLLRDNVVFENWEGSHNTLLMQVLRDCQVKKMHQSFFQHLLQQAQGHARLTEVLITTRDDFDVAIKGDQALATLNMRFFGSRMAWLQWAAAMHQDGTERRTVDHFLNRRFAETAPHDLDYLQRVKELVMASNST
ncbi:MAG: hypothetical protein A2289_18805 [Deltaproteobacteria bacterium RIFOXYA12_FULL_58_15]|nr:MAG: hypothetical protein A2289_18805 [Deltaproteobacteria bacterium RIFOXYA12_FULL_58_15]